MNFVKLSSSFNLRSVRLFSKGRSIVHSRMSQEHFSVCFADKTVHFTKINDYEDQKNLSVQSVPISEVSWSTLCLKNIDELFIISSPKSDIHDSEQNSYIQSCLDLNEIFRSSKTNPTFCLGFTNARLDQRDHDIAGGRYSRILCAAFSGDADIKNLKSTVTESCHGEIFKLNVLTEKTQLISLTPVDSTNIEVKSSFWKLCEDDNPAILKCVFDKEEISPVFQDVETALAVLDKYKSIPQVTKVLDIFNREMEKYKELESQDLKFPFVVIEGLDAAGKSTLTESLERKLGAVRYCSPPPVIQHLRKYFVSLPEILARAYYHLGNYIIAEQIKLECQHHLVIMDRYWHSTAAYGIANESSLADLPQIGHKTYNWPSALVKPSLVLFLSVTESTRQQRMTSRAGDMTFEEKALDSDLFFRKKLHETYKRMKNPCCIAIDADGTKDSVEKKAIAVLKEHDIYI